MEIICSAITFNVYRRPT